MPTRSSAYTLSWRAALALPLLASLGLFTGCGAGVLSGPSNPSGLLVQGKVMGGQSPIQGSTIRLYATSASATDYGQAATLIGTTTTDANGNFNIQPTVTCPGGQQTYITSAGGYQSSPAPYTATTTANTSTLEMAALGPCHVLGTAAYQNGFVINEVTSVAAAYALSGFMTTSVGSDGLSVANVSAPSSNNSLTTAITATAPAGLTHAFLNAANLVSPANPSSTVAGGTANSTFVVSVAGANPTVSVPAVEINTLADMMASCVNGLTGNANCTSLFSLTPSLGGNTAQNTLQAFIYLARNPYPSAAAMGTGSGSLLGLVPASGAAFSPTLSGAPTDYSLAITYGRAGSATALPAPYWTSMDMNDTAYFGETSAAKTNAVFGVSAYGIASPAFAPGSTAHAYGVAADALGNVWVSNGSQAAYQLSTTSGSLVNTATTTSASGGQNGLAVDKQNNLWVATGTANVPNLLEFPSTGGTTASFQATLTFGMQGVNIDASQNVWPAGYYTNGNLAQEIVNTRTVASPLYSTTAVTATLNGTSTKVYNNVFDASGNAWLGITGSNTVSTTGIEEVVPAVQLNNGTLTPKSLITGATNGSNGNPLGITATQMMAIDGAGTIFIPNNTTGGNQGLSLYNTQNGAVLNPAGGLYACYLATSTTTACGAAGSTSAVYNPRQPMIDSTGSVWVGYTTGGVTQVIGLAAPTYPLLSIGMPGLAPGKVDGNGNPVVLPLP